MADLPVLPAKGSGEAGHVALHELIRLGFLEAETRMDTLEAGGGSHVHAGSDITSSTLGLAYLPAGSQIVVDKIKNGGTWPARPTARTDVTVKWIGDTDPAGATINGDVWSELP